MKRSYVVALVLLVMVTLVMTGCARKKTTTAVQADLQRVHFDFDRSNIKSEYQGTLASNAKWMQANANTNVTIEGHCDERGSVEYNIALGDRRANSTKSYLKNLGVSATRMNTISYGKERPLCTEHNESCWWRNRRADFVAK
ncbi:MAG: peptidoglycan-associated lipoprotein Pal [Pseudomonadota bacterium]